MDIYGGRGTGYEYYGTVCSMMKKRNNLQKVS